MSRMPTRFSAQVRTRVTSMVVTVCQKACLHPSISFWGKAVPGDQCLNSGIGSANAPEDFRHASVPTWWNSQRSKIYLRRVDKSQQLGV
jgi:hypothetical protein